MSESSSLQQLAKKETTAEAITAKVIQNPDLLPEIFQGLNEKAASIKYGCLKVMRLISEQQPAMLYPHFNFFVDLLDSEVTLKKQNWLKPFMRDPEKKLHWRFIQP
jgi:hypothetical protein